jgi:K(+)-stimulated pyrophosphate-energized sodium pump
MNLLKKIFSIGTLAVTAVTFGASLAHASEADLIVPNLASGMFMGVDGRSLLIWGIGICILGFVFGIVQFTKIMNMPVHKSMKDISELIFQTCKTYLITQGKFLLVLELIVGIVMVAYFGGLRHLEAAKVIMILICSLIGIAGSYGVAWFGMLINTMANSR